jgi:hypothetical protein
MVTTRKTPGPAPLDEVALEGVTGGTAGWLPSQGGEGLEAEWTPPPGGGFQGLGAAPEDTGEATPEATPNRKFMS